MKTSHPSYIVADLPEQTFFQVMDLRRSCCRRKDKIPAEITLAGSSGVGPIPIGTDISFVKDIVSDILRNLISFEVSFSGWKVFPNTTIAYLDLSSRAIFDFLHKRLSDSQIPFSDIKFPYNTHCIIGSSWEPNELEAVSKIVYPTDPFFISSVSFLELNVKTLECRELARFILSK